MLLSLLLLSILNHLPPSIKDSYMGQVVILSVFSLISKVSHNKPITIRSVVGGIAVNMVLVGIFRAIHSFIQKILEKENLQMSVLAKIIAWIITVIIIYFLFIFSLAIFVRTVIYMKGHDGSEAYFRSLMSSTP